LSSWYRDNLYPPREVVDDGEPIATAVKALVKWSCNVNMEEFHGIFPSSPLFRAVVGLFNHSSLEAWVAWLTWFHIPDAVGLSLKPL
jgi:hypothetical protein